MKRDTIIKIIDWQEGYTLIPNAFAQDHTISDGARSMMLDFLSRPKDWSISVAGTQALQGIGRDKIRKQLHELEAAEYASFDEDRNAGQFSGGIWHVCADKDKIRELNRAKGRTSPETENTSTVTSPATENPAPENPATENLPLHTKETTKERENKHFAMKASQRSLSDEVKPVGQTSAEVELKPSTSEIPPKKTRKAKAADVDGFRTRLWNIYPEEGRNDWGVCVAKYAKLSEQDREAAIAGVAGYKAFLARKGNEYRRAKDLKTYLHQTTWTTYQLEASAPSAQAPTREKQIQLVALDLDNGSWTRAVKWWPSPEVLMKEARDIYNDACRYIAENFPQSNFQAAA